MSAPKDATDGIPVAEIRAQLDRILASAHFRNSRRCQALLQHVVAAATESRFDALKERVVGCEVFGREPDYDTNEDAVVRNAAAEVRKRLAQYYLESSHDEELRISLPPGSYLPEFHPHSAAHSVQLPPLPPSRRPRSLVQSGALMLAGALLGGLAVFLLTASPNVTTTRTELDDFWQPTLATPGDVQILIGQSRGHFLRPSAGGGPISPSDPNAKFPASLLTPMRDTFMYFGDSFCLARINGYLLSRGKTSRFRGSAVTPYSEVRGQPVVLIGAFNNQWTQRLTEGLRFALVNDGPAIRGVRDAQRGEHLPWKMVFGGAGWLAEEDYALVTRIFDPRTERVVVAAGGIGHYGTMSTGDFLSNAEYFRAGLKSAPRDWKKRNMQFVLRVKVADGTPGPPEVLATHFW